MNKYNYKYVEIIEAVSKLIPDTWNRIWFYGEILKDSTDVYYYFESKSTGKLICCMDIPEEYDIDEDDYYDRLEELAELIEELHLLFIENNEDKWTNFTMISDKDGKFDISFDYEDVSRGIFSLRERHVIWRYKVLDMQPQDSYSKNVIDKYLNSIK